MAIVLQTPQIIECAMPTWYIYAARFSSSASKRCDIRTALKEDLRYAVRWMIFIDALGLGAVIVCGEAIARLVCVRSAVPSLVLTLCRYKTSGTLMMISSGWPRESGSVAQSILVLRDCDDFHDLVQS